MGCLKKSNKAHCKLNENQSKIKIKPYFTLNERKSAQCHCHGLTSVLQSISKLHFPPLSRLVTTVPHCFLTITQPGAM